MATAGHGGGRGCVDGHRHGGGRGGWIAETFSDCDAVVTAGIGAGAVSALRSAGVRLVVLDRPTQLADALSLYAGGGRRS